MSSIARTQIHRRRCAGNDHYKSLSARLDHSNFFHYYYSQKGMKKGGRRRWIISVICSWCGVTRWICCCCLMNSAGWAFVSNKLQIGFVECAPSILCLSRFSTRLFNFSATRINVPGRHLFYRCRIPTHFAWLWSLYLHKFVEAKTPKCCSSRRRTKHKTLNIQANALNTAINHLAECFSFFFVY